MRHASTAVTRFSTLFYLLLLVARAAPVGDNSEREATSRGGGAAATVAVAKAALDQALRCQRHHQPLIPIDYTAEPTAQPRPGGAGAQAFRHVQRLVAHLCHAVRSLPSAVWSLLQQQEHERTKHQQRQQQQLLLENQQQQQESVVSLFGTHAEQPLLTPVSMRPARRLQEQQQQQQYLQRAQQWRAAAAAAASAVATPLPDGFVIPRTSPVPAEPAVQLYSPDQLRLRGPLLDDVPADRQIISLAEQMQQAAHLHVTLSAEQLQTAAPLLGRHGPLLPPPRSRPAADFPEGYVAVCAIVRDQGPDLREWIEYHAWLGVAKFYIYDNNSTVFARAQLCASRRHCMLCRADPQSHQLHALLHAYKQCTHSCTHTLTKHEYTHKLTHTGTSGCWAI